MVQEKLIFLKLNDENEGKKRNIAPHFGIFSLSPVLAPGVFVISSSSSASELKEEKVEELCGRDTGSDQLEQQVLDGVQALAGLPQGSL